MYLLTAIVCAFACSPGEAVEASDRSAALAPASRVEGIKVTAKLMAEAMALAKDSVNSEKLAIHIRRRFERGQVELNCFLMALWNARFWPDKVEYAIGWVTRSVPPDKEGTWRRALEALKRGENDSRENPQQAAGRVAFADSQLSHLNVQAGLPVVARDRFRTELPIPADPGLEAAPITPRSTIGKTTVTAYGMPDPDDGSILVMKGGFTMDKESPLRYLLESVNPFCDPLKQLNVSACDFRELGLGGYAITPWEIPVNMQQSAHEAIFGVEGTVGQQFWILSHRRRPVAIVSGGMHKAIHMIPVTEEAEEEFIKPKRDLLFGKIKKVTNADVKYLRMTTRPQVITFGRIYPLADEPFSAFGAVEPPRGVMLEQIAEQIWGRLNNILQQRDQQQERGARLNVLLYGEGLGAIASWISLGRGQPQVDLMSTSVLGYANDRWWAEQHSHGRVRVFPPGAHPSDVSGYDLIVWMSVTALKTEVPGGITPAHKVLTGILDGSMPIRLHPAQGDILLLSPRNDPELDKQILNAQVFATNFTYSVGDRRLTGARIPGDPQARVAWYLSNKLRPRGGQVVDPSAVLEAIRLVKLPRGSQVLDMGFESGEVSLTLGALGMVVTAPYELPQDGSPGSKALHDFHESVKHLQEKGVLYGGQVREIPYRHPSQLTLRYDQFPLIHLRIRSDQSWPADMIRQWMQVMDANATLLISGYHASSGYKNLQTYGVPDDTGRVRLVLMVPQGTFRLPPHQSIVKLDSRLGTLRIFDYSL